MKKLLLLLLFPGLLFAEPQYDCGESANGQTPNAAKCSVPGLILPTNAAAIDCESGITAVNPSAANELIVKNGLTKAQAETSTYTKYFFCDTDQHAAIQLDLTNMNCGARTGGKCYFLGWHDNDGQEFDDTIHPYNRTPTDRSVIDYFRCDGVCNNIVIKNLVFAGDPTDSQPYLLIKWGSGTDSGHQIVQNWFDTWDELGLGDGPYLDGGTDRTYEQKCPAFTVNFLTQNDSRVDFHYNYINGDYTALLECDNDDTGGLRTNNFSQGIYAVGNEIKNTGDNVMLQASESIQVFTSPDYYFHGNNIYKDEDDWVSCLDATDQTAPSRAEECQCGENNWDIKLGSEAGSDPILLENNITSGGRPQAPRISGGLSFECGGTGAKGGSDVVLHLQNQHTALVGNIWYNTHSIMGLTAGCHALEPPGCPQNTHIALNYFHDIEQSHQSAASFPDATGPPPSYAVSNTKHSNMALMQNQYTGINANVDYCIRNNVASVDIQGELADINCTWDITNSNSIEDVTYTNGAAQIGGGETDPHTIASMTFQNLTFCTKPISGALLTTGPYAGHRCDQVSLPVVADTQANGLAGFTQNPAYGPQ